MEQNQQIFDRERLKIRCPDCLKLYSVNTNEIAEARPRFQCVDCESQFWVSFPEALSMGEEILGYPLSWIEEAEKAPTAAELRSPSAHVFACPKCGQGYAAGDSECVKCGIVFIKIKDSQRPNGSELSAAIEVRESWDAVLNNYENYSLHQTFINAAFADKSLAYAAGQYSKILEVCPHDEIAQRAQKEVSALAFARFDSNIVRDSSKEAGLFGGFDISFKKLRITTLILFFSAVVITFGIFMPHQRNLVGVGTAVMFFILALRYYFRVI